MPVLSFGSLLVKVKNRGETFPRVKFRINCGSHRLLSAPFPTPITARVSSSHRFSSLFCRLSDWLWRWSASLSSPSPNPKLTGAPGSVHGLAATDLSLLRFFFFRSFLCNLSLNPWPLLLFLSHDSLDLIGVLSVDLAKSIDDVSIIAAVDLQKIYI